jgi:hypothetical protein
MKVDMKDQEMDMTKVGLMVDLTELCLEFHLVECLVDLKVVLKDKQVVACLVINLGFRLEKYLERSLAKKLAHLLGKTKDTHWAERTVANLVVRLGKKLVDSWVEKSVEQKAGKMELN